jgi:hypothetical protein
MSGEVALEVVLPPESYRDDATLTTMANNALAADVALSVQEALNQPQQHCGQGPRVRRSGQEWVDPSRPVLAALVTAPGRHTCSHEL